MGKNDFDISAINIKAPSSLSDDDINFIKTKAIQWVETKKGVGNRNLITRIINEKFRNNDVAVDFYKECKNVFLNKQKIKVLTDKDKEQIAEWAKKWTETTKGTGQRNVVTANFKKVYKNNIEADRYFDMCKNKNKAPQKKNEDHSELSIYKRKLSDIISNHIKETFLKSNYDKNLFNFDDTFNIDKYFWIRFNNLINDKITKDPDKKHMAYSLAIILINKNEQDFIWGLTNIDFNDQKHLWNYILKFISDRILITYKTLVEEKRRRKIEDEKIKQEESIKQKQQEILDSIKTDDADEVLSEETIVVKKPKKRNYDEYM